MNLLSRNTSNQSTTTEPGRINNVRPVRTHTKTDEQSIFIGQSKENCRTGKMSLIDGQSLYQTYFSGNLCPFIISTHKQAIIYKKSRNDHKEIPALNVFGNQPKTLPINKSLYIKPIVKPMLFNKQSNNIDYEQK